MEKYVPLVTVSNCIYCIVTLALFGIKDMQLSAAIDMLQYYSYYDVKPNICCP